MKIFYSTLRLLGIGALVVPMFAFAANPSFSVLGLQEVRPTDATILVGFDSNGVDYSYEAQPKITVLYTNQSTGETQTSVTIGQSQGVRSNTFALRNLVPNTVYSYKAVMNYGGIAYETIPSKFTTKEKTTLTLTTQNVTPTGTPSISIIGIQDVTYNDALISFSFDSKDSNYSYSTQPRIFIEYAENAKDEVFTSTSVNESMGARTTLMRILNLKPNTKYSFRVVMLYPGSTRTETDTRTFTTKDYKQVIFSGPSNTTSTSTSTKDESYNLFPSAPATISKSIGVTKVTSNLESIIKTGGYGKKNGVALSITDSHARVLRGDSFDYIINYHNENNKSLKTARIVVQLPSPYQFDAGDGNTVYSEKNNTVTIYLGTIAANESGSVSFRAKALEGENTGVETKAMLVYTGGSVSATDRDTYVGGSQGVLGATVFGAGFFPQTFFGWLVIILVLVFIMIIARRYMQPKDKINK